MSKKVDYILDEMGKIESLTIDGKPCKAGFMRGLRKAQNSTYWRLLKDGLDHFAQNPFSGVTVTLTDFEFSLYYWLSNWYRLYSRGENDAPIQAYDDVKYLLLEINRDAYYDLID